ncbi:hypothetical protein JCM16303_001664 [Sporobolomyces ruberrimus]
MVSHRAAIRAAAVLTKVRQNRTPGTIPSTPSPSSSPAPSSDGPSRRTTSLEAPNAAQWANPYPRPSTPATPPSPSSSSNLDFPKPPFVEVMDPAVFSHRSLLGDLREFKLERPLTGQEKKLDRRVETFEKLELVGKILLKMTVTELVMNHYRTLTVPAIETLVNCLLQPSHLISLSTHYSLTTLLVSDPVATKYLRLSPQNQTSLFHAYVAGIYQQEGFQFVTSWIRKCFRERLVREYQDLITKLGGTTSIETIDDGDGEMTNNEQDLVTKNQRSPVIPQVMPLIQLDALIKRENLDQPRWNFLVKGNAPDQVFKAELTIGDKTTEGSGKTKNWARQSAAAAYLGIRDLDSLFLQHSLLPQPATSYTPRLFSLLRELELPPPQFKTCVWPKSPHYKCELDVMGKVFVATSGNGKIQVRRLASKMALDHFNPCVRLESALLDYIHSNEYSISFRYALLDRDPPELEGQIARTGEGDENEKRKSRDEWACTIKVRANRDVSESGKSEDIAVVVGRGLTRIAARGTAVKRAAEMFGIEQGAEDEGEDERDREREVDEDVESDDAEKDR